MLSIPELTIGQKCLDEEMKTMGAADEKQQGNRTTVVLNNGRHMPVVGLGTSMKNRGRGLDEKESEKVQKAVERALEMGYRCMDTAYQYEVENEVGSAIRKKIADGTVTREEVFVITKLANIYHKPEKVLPAIKKSLQNLQLDYIDLYLIHSPFGMKYIDEKTMFPKDENGMGIIEPHDHVAIWKEMEKAVDMGHVHSIGLSNFNEEQIQRILDHARIKPANLQVEGHAYFMQESLFQFCQRNSITFTCYSPLGSPGWIASKNKEKSEPRPILIEDPVVKITAQKHGKSVAQVLLRYLLQEGRCVVPKSVTEERIQENFRIFDFELDAEDMQKLRDLSSKNVQYMLPDFDFMKHSPEYPFHTK